MATSTLLTMITLEEAEASLQINQEALDTELARQPQLVFSVGRATSQALALSDTAKDAVKVAEASAQREARAALQATGERVTEAMVSAQTQLQPVLVAAREEYGSALALSREWQAMQDAVHARGFALLKLADIELQHQRSVGMATR